MQHLPSINQESFKTIYNQSVITLSSQKDKAVVGLNHLWQGSVNFCSAKKTALTPYGVKCWNQLQVISNQLQNEIKAIPAKMQADENVALAVIASCNAAFMYAMDAIIDTLNKQLDRLIPLQPGKLKSLKHILLNDGLFAAAIFALNGVAIPKILGYSMGKWAVIITVVSTVVRHIWKKNNEKFEQLNNENQVLIRDLRHDLNLANGQILAQQNLNNDFNQVVLDVAPIFPWVNDVEQQLIEIQENIAGNNANQAMNDINDRLASCEGDIDQIKNEQLQLDVKWERTRQERISLENNVKGYQAQVKAIQSKVDTINNNNSPANSQKKNRKNKHNVNVV